MVDFPGVDDEDDSIGDLADLLLTIAQIVVFVVDYRYLLHHACILPYSQHAIASLFGCSWGGGTP